ncbi:MAG TPA: cytochrome b/b6 domain-containing protein [Acidimicrobiales bacterium]|nr:cytochrome b/b6 domain-containing protein [Acidimicrobiales bacterium]
MDSREPVAEISRFDRVERVVHWANALLFIVLIATGFTLYIGPLSLFVGRRDLVQTIHVYCGLALPVPVVAALAGRWGRGLRADLRRFNRWSSDDRGWLRAAASNRAEREARRSAVTVGKFNAGQKLNVAFTAGVIVVMLGTGVIMRWYSPWPLSWRTGATFVHDWLAIAAVAVVVGHIAYALSDPAAMRSMVRGTISRRWAEHHAPGWLAEDAVGSGAALTGTPGGPLSDPGTRSAQPAVWSAPAGADGRDATGRA